MNSLRVGVVAACPFPVPQGSQAYIGQTLRALQYAGHHPALVCYGHGVGEIPDNMEVIRCRRIPGDARTAAGPSLIKPLLDLALARTVAGHRWDALLAHNYEGLLAALCSRIRPVIYLPHNALADELPHYFRGAAAARWVGAWLDAALPRRADAVLALHAPLADYLSARGCAPQRMQVCPPSAPLDYFQPPAFGTTPYVLYTGNLDRYQNLPMLEAGMRIVRRSLPHVRCMIATHAVPTIGHARMHSCEVQTVASFAETAVLLQQDVVVASPRVSWSGYPMKLLNALAAGRPAVVCASAPGPYVHGQQGLVAPDNDPQAFAASLVTLLTDHSLRAQLGCAAWRTAQEEYTLARQAEQLDRVLRACVPVSS